MITYGIKTWKSIAVSSVFFLGLAVFLFLNAIQAYLKIREEVKEYGQLTCILEGESNDGILEQILTSDQGSYVYEIGAVIQSESVKKELCVTGIDTQMIPGKLVGGTYYSDHAGSFSLVMNLAALSELMEEESKNEKEAASWIGRTLIMGNSSAKICGIIKDDSDTPSLFISIPAAKSYLKQQGETPKASSYCVCISDLKSLINTKEKIEEIGIAASIDDDRLFQWKLMNSKIKDWIIMGLIAIAAFISSIILSVKVIQHVETPQGKRVYAARICMSICVGTVIGVLCNMFVSLWR